MGTVKPRRRKKTLAKKVEKSADGLPVLKANMFGIDFRELEDCTHVSFEFIDVRVVGKVAGTDYVEVVAVDDGTTYRLSTSEFGRVVPDTVGMIHEYSGSKYGYAYLPF